MESPFVLKPLACLLVVLATTACDDSRRLEAERAAQAHQVRVMAVTGQLQAADAERAALDGQLADAQRRAQLHRAEHDELQQRLARLEREAQAFMMNHKLAVAAIALGVGGGTVALDDSGRFTEGARQIGAAMSLVAAGYALFNAEEVARVADGIMQLESMATQLQAGIAAAEAGWTTARAEADALQARRDAAGTQADALRQQLLALQGQASKG